MRTEVIKGGPFLIVPIEPEDEVSTQELKPGRRIRIQIFNQRNRIPVISPLELRPFFAVLFLAVLFLVEARFLAAMARA